MSLDDGATWTRTNLSNSALATSGLFQLTDPVPDPADPACHHSADTTTEDLVASLTSVSVSSSESEDDDEDRGRGRGGRDDDDDDDSDGLTIEEAEYDAEDGELEVEGEADRRDRVTIINAATGDVLCETRADRRGEFECEIELAEDEVPCSVAAVVGDETSDAVEVENAPEQCVGEPPVAECQQLDEYPGDVWNIFHAVAGNKVLVAWHSKYCTSGFPGYTGGNTDADTIAGYLGIDRTSELYLEDLFGVAGSQQSVDYKEQEAFDGEYDGVGEVPYGCLWSARGVLRENPDVPDTSEMVWFQAERLTSGRRDVNRVEVSCVAGGGCGITWQEDPEGLRPGEGEGAGTGWAGATVTVSYTHLRAHETRR